MHFEIRIILGCDRSDAQHLFGNYQSFAHFRCRNKTRLCLRRKKKYFDDKQNHKYIQKGTTTFPLTWNLERKQSNLPRSLCIYCLWLLSPDSTVNRTIVSIKPSSHRCHLMLLFT
jgi:hypothetical protein